MSNFMCECSSPASRDRVVIQVQSRFRVGGTGVVSMCCQRPVSAYHAMTASPRTFDSTYVIGRKKSAIDECLNSRTFTEWDT